jgi:hypothetical protein
MHPLVAAYLVVALFTAFYTLRQVPDETGPLAPDWIDRFVLALTAILAGAAWPLLTPFILAAWWRSPRVRAAREWVIRRVRPRSRVRPFSGAQVAPALEQNGSETPGRLAP